MEQSAGDAGEQDVSAACADEVVNVGGEVEHSPLEPEPVEPALVEADAAWGSAGTGIAAVTDAASRAEVKGEGWLPSAAPGSTSSARLLDTPGPAGMQSQSAMQPSSGGTPVSFVSASPRPRLVAVSGHRNQRPLPAARSREHSRDRCGACHKCGAQIKDQSKTRVCDVCCCRCASMKLSVRAGIFQAHAWLGWTPAAFSSRFPPMAFDGFWSLSNFHFTFYFVTAARSAAGLARRYHVFDCGLRCQAAGLASPMADTDCPRVRQA